MGRNMDNKRYAECDECDKDYEATDPTQWGIKDLGSKRIVACAKCMERAHRWAVTPEGLVFCRKCMVVQRADGKNKDCKGRQLVEGNPREKAKHQKAVAIDETESP